MSNRKAALQKSLKSPNQPSPDSSDIETSSDASSAAVVKTLEHRRFAEFCDACKRYRYIGLCYGAPGVGKTVSARHYTNWDRMQDFWNHPGRDSAAVEEIAAGTTVFYTAPVVGSPRLIETQIGKLRDRPPSMCGERLRRRKCAGSLGFSMTFVIALRIRMDIAARRLRTLKTPSFSNGIVRWD